MIIFSAEKVAISLVQNPFMVNIDDVKKNLKEEILDLKASETANMMFFGCNLTKFWLSQTEVYERISRIAWNYLLPIATTYLCEQGFST